MKRQKTGGRKKGTPNKRTELFQQLIAQLNFDPTVELVKELKKPLIAKSLNKIFDKDKAKILMALHEYLYPRRKAIEEAAPPPVPEDSEDENLEDISTEELMELANGKVQ